MEPTTQTPRDIHPTDAEDESVKAIGKGMSRQFRQRAFRWLQQARVTRVDIDPDTDGWTGTVAVELLTMAGTRAGVRMTLPIAGNAQFAGGPPLENTVVVIGWLPAGLPMIVGYMPPLPGDMEALGKLRRLEPGEYLLQAGVKLPTGEQVPGGSVHLKASGEVETESRDPAEKAVLTRERSGATGVDDPDTEAEIHYQIAAVDADGNVKGAVSIDTDGNILIDAPGSRVILRSSDVRVGADDVNDLDTLVTRQWVRDVFDKHTHLSAPTGSVSGPSAGVLESTIPLPDGAFTEKLRSK